MISLNDEQEIVSGNTPETEPANRIFYPALDGLRALAVMMVFMQHYFGMPYGWVGVDIFFVLSGFLITGILYDTRKHRHRFKNFYVRRTLRIFPLYYAVLLAIVLVAPWMHWNWNWRWWTWPLYLGNYIRFIPLNAYLHNPSLEDIYGHIGKFGLSLGFSHFWSLCVEEQFYLFWPLIVFIVFDRLKLIRICAAVCLILPLIRTILLHIAPPKLLSAEFLYRVTALRMDALLLGGLIALLLRGGNGRLLQRVAPRLFFCGIAAIAAIFAIAHFFFGYNQAFTSLFGGFDYTIIDLLAAALMVMALKPENAIYWFFNIRPLRALGKLSYGFYIFHALLQEIYGTIYRRSLGVFLPHTPRVFEFMTAITGFLGTLLIASLSYRYFESPFLSLKQRWTR